MSTTNNYSFRAEYEEYLRPRTRYVRRVKLRTACGCEKIYEGVGIDSSTTIRLQISTPSGQRTTDIVNTVREFVYAGEFDHEYPIFREVIDRQLEFLDELKRENIKLKSDYTKLHDSVFGMAEGL